jgi:hypothetical protein
VLEAATDERDRQPRRTSIGWSPAPRGQPATVAAAGPPRGRGGHLLARRLIEVFARGGGGSGGEQELMLAGVDLSYGLGRVDEMSQPESARPDRQLVGLVEPRAVEEVADRADAAAVGCQDEKAAAARQPVGSVERAVPGRIDGQPSRRSHQARCTPYRPASNLTRCAAEAACVPSARVLRTICGSNVPLRSLGVSIRTSPCSVISVFGVDPLRVLPRPPGGSWFGS